MNPSQSPKPLRSGSQHGRKDLKEKSAGQHSGLPISAAARWVLWATLVVVPLAIWPHIPSFISVYVMIKSVLLGYAGALILLLAGLGLLFQKEAFAHAREWAARPPAWGFLGLAVAVVAATLAAQKPVRDFAWSEAWLYLLPLSVGAVCGWLMRSVRYARSTAWAMIATGFLVAILGLLDATGIIPLLKWTAGGRTLQQLVEQGTALQGGTSRGRLVSTLGNPAYVGGFLVIPMVLLGGWLIAGWEGERPGWKKALGGWVALAIMGVTMVATSTREAWLGVAVGVAARLWLADRTPRPAKEPGRARRGIPTRGWVAVGAMAAGLIALLIVFSTPNPINVRGWNVARRFTELTNPRSDSIRERLMFYTLAGRMVSQRPLLGWGPGMYGVRFYPTVEQFLDQGPYGPWAWMVENLHGRVADKPHNDFIQIAVECGIVGLAAMVWLVASLLVLSSLRARHPPPADAKERAGTLRVMAAAWIAGLSTLLTSFPLHTPARALYFWVLTGVVSALLLPNLLSRNVTDSNSR